MLSIMPPVFPILKQPAPGLTQPTMAGPMMVTFLLLDTSISYLV